jgi:hypothetical protein
VAGVRAFAGDSDGISSRTHWSYRKPAFPPLPPVKDAQWSRNPIDRFVLARMESDGLTPSPEASKARLLRRVTLNLTGLPPTPEEADQFIRDTGPDAYDRAVERLLASPGYGERWARVWLDLARYADTCGYEADQRRTVWPYRDWVIDALNRNMSFDQFTIEQIAGDLLPNPTQAQRVATGFHRNTMTNNENGTDDEEFRYEAIVDRVNTTMAVWMGTSFNCAQCHNHKYDPFSQREYYQLFAFLNNTADSDKADERPTMKVIPLDQQEKLRCAIAAAEGDLADIPRHPSAALAAWERRSVSWLAPWQVLDPGEFKSTGGSVLSKQPDKSLLAEGANPANDTYTITAEVGPIQLNSVLLEILPFGPEQSLGRHEAGNFVVTSFELSVQPANTRRTVPVRFESVRADNSYRGYSVENLLNGKSNGWMIAAYVKKNRIRHAAQFTPVRPVDLPQGGRLIFTIKHSDATRCANLQNFRLWCASRPAAEIPPYAPAAILALLKTPLQERTEEQTRLLRDFCDKEQPELAAARFKVDALRDSESAFLKEQPATAVMVELDKPRETRLHVRGSYLKTGEVVTPGTPAALHPFPANQPLNRLGLAHWLIDSNNPLTARVQVNRFWEQYFGTGMVETVEEFGSQGEKPSHPELLDWLASEFVRSGWDMKAIHRLIVTSATYCQSARVTPDLYRRDPYNRLLARGPRIRLDAEMIRDQALAVSGLLSRKIGGPGVMPPQPPDLWQMIYNSDRWIQSVGEDQYRRALYTFWRRTVPYPMMVTFDAPSREFCQLRRTRSDTPLQALNLLNDPVFVTAAQALARRIVDHPGDRREKAAYAFQLCLTRAPNVGELERIIRLYEGELAHYASDPSQTAAMAAHAVDPGLQIPHSTEFAAWTVVGNILLNLDEMMNRG